MVREYDSYRQALLRAGFCPHVVRQQIIEAARIDASLDELPEICPACGSGIDKALEHVERGVGRAEYFCGCGFMHVRSEDVS